MPEKFFLKKSSQFALISVAMMTLAGCAVLPTDAPVSPVDYKACVVEEKLTIASPLAEVADYGVKQAVVTYGISRNVTSVIDAKLESTVSKLIKKGCNLFVLSGAGFADQLRMVAKGNPTANFVYISDQAQPALVYANLENLVVYSVDTYEAGLLTGFLSAGLSDNNRVLTGVCPIAGFVGPFSSGANDGIAKYQLLSGRAIEKIATLDALPPNGPNQPDVTMATGCGLVEVENILTNTESKLVGYGRDLYNELNLSKVKNRLAVTVQPQLGEKILDLIGSDLDGDFIGGSFGSFHATFGNNGLELTPEHDVNISPILIDDLKKMAADYEASLKKIGTK